MKNKFSCSKQQAASSKQQAASSKQQAASSKQQAAQFLLLLLFHNIVAVDRRGCTKDLP
jgi:hypothetical protein